MVLAQRDIESSLYVQTVDMDILWMISHFWTERAFTSGTPLAYHRMCEPHLQQLTEAPEGGARTETTVHRLAAPWMKADHQPYLQELVEVGASDRHRHSIVTESATSWWSDPPANKH